MFSHDIENFAGLQRLFDAILAGGRTFINSVILSTVLAKQDELAGEAAEHGKETASFIVYRTPVRYFNSHENVESIVESAWCDSEGRGRQPEQP